MKHRDLLLLLVILPFWSNFLIRVYAWMIILGPNAALATRVNGVLGWFGHEPVPLLFSSFAVLVCLVYVHLPFMVLPLYANLEKHDQALLDAAQDLGADAWQRFWRITFPLSLPGVYAGAALVFIPALGIFAIPGHPGRPRRQPDRQRDQAAVPRDARLAVRQRAVDRADRRGAGARRRSRRGSAAAAWATPSSAGRLVRRRSSWLWAAALRRLRVPLRAAASSSSSIRSTTRASTPNGWASRSTGTQAVRQPRHAARGRQLAADRRSSRASCRRCWARWPGWRCTATGTRLLPVLVLTPIAIPEILMGVIAADLLRAAQLHAGTGVGRARAHRVLHRLRRDRRARAPGRHGREPDRGGARLRRDAAGRRFAT